MKTQPRFQIPVGFGKPEPVTGCSIHRYYQIGATRPIKIEWFCYGLTVGLLLGIMLMMFVSSKLP